MQYFRGSAATNVGAPCRIFLPPREPGLLPPTACGSIKRSLPSSSPPLDGVPGTFAPDGAQTFKDDSYEESIGASVPAP